VVGGRLAKLKVNTMEFNDIKNELVGLFQTHFGQTPETIVALPRSGSDRIYFRLKSANCSAIGAYNADVVENEAFFSFTQSFMQSNIRVPELYGIAANRLVYLQQDLGTETLLDKLNEGNLQRLCYLKKTLKQLPRLQVEAAANIDFSKCYPRKSFDYRSVMWDLNYFKYQFLKIAGIPFNEELLENDFERLAGALTQSEFLYFMCRDFQSRNVMWHNDEPWFIDYQGGRRGPLQYDVVSLLYSPKSGLNSVEREALLQFYIDELQQYISVPNSFERDYYVMALLRVVQALGAYGFRGIVENKPNFKTSIPVAIANLNELLVSNRLQLELPELYAVIERMAQSEWAEPLQVSAEKLTVRIESFSYKKRLPIDPSENGGGFVIDCRGLPNPGRYKEYRSLSGIDAQVIDYLEKYPQVHDFAASAQAMLKISIENYIERKFSHLSICFGCTGGQHRSVYNAEKTKRWIENNFDVNVVLIHNEMKNWKRDE
jgi:aminoglycoside/choline kinase family phosphotransferase